ncbi:hypothetical protein [Cypionkella psychrotolerans]|uniref:hypothetical protein n=1 Tax=Cypionkella psychrotolerans TaxID=1678131 RepID=UPI000A514FD7|nr:hypothetical protein [Cypionkella psychrotolerans]
MSGPEINAELRVTLRACTFDEDITTRLEAKMAFADALEQLAKRLRNSNADEIDVQLVDDLTGMSRGSVFMSIRGAA